VNPKQLVIGAAFYGRAWKGVQPDKNGLYQSNKGPFGEGVSYETIREKYENKNGYTKYWDSVAKAPYLFNPTDSIFISYDDTSSVELKTKYAIDKELGGIMFWQLGGDTKNHDGLLNSIFETATDK
jgi:chitinase